MLSSFINSPPTQEKEMLGKKFSCGGVKAPPCERKKKINLFRHRIFFYMFCNTETEK